MKQKAHRWKYSLSIRTFVIYLPQWRLRKELLPRFTVQMTSDNDKGNQSICQKTSNFTVKSICRQKIIILPPKSVNNWTQFKLQNCSKGTTEFKKPIKQSKIKSTRRVQNFKNLGRKLQLQQLATIWWTQISGKLPLWATDCFDNKN